MIKLSSLGSKVLVENETLDPYSVDRDEVDFIIVDTTHVSFNIFGGVPVALSNLEIEGDIPSDVGSFKTLMASVFPNAGGAATPTLDQVLDEGASANSRIHDLTDPENDQDAATKKYIDQNIESLSSGITLDSILDGDEGLTADRVIDIKDSVLTVVSTEYPSGLLRVIHDEVVLGDVDGSTNNTSVQVDDQNSAVTINATKLIHNGGQEFADNAAAVTGGLAVGTHYRTGDVVKIVHA